MLNLKLLVHLLFPPFIVTRIFAYLKHIFLDFGIQLFLKNGKHITGTDKSIAIVVVEHERDQMRKTNTHICKPLSYRTKFFVIDVGPYLEETDQPLCKALSNYRSYIVFKQIFV